MAAVSSDSTVLSSSGPDLHFNEVCVCVSAGGVNKEKTSKPQRLKSSGEAGGGVAGFHLRQQQSGSHPPPHCGVT